MSKFIMNDFWNNFNHKKILKTQIGRSAIIMLLAILVISGVYFLASNNKNQKIKITQEGNNKPIEIKTGAGLIDDNQTWRSIFEENLAQERLATQKELASLKEQLLVQQQLMKDLAQPQNDTSSTRDQFLLEKIRYLEALVTRDTSSQAEAIEKIPPKLLSQQFQTPPQKKDHRNYVLPGTFAKAVLLHGTNASTSLNASSDPEPMTLELLDEGVLPGNFKSHLKQCRIIASSYGNLSSERVKIRLESLSCIDSATELPVYANLTGYVVGGDARIGTRGTVISREGKLIANSFISGALGGLSQSAKSNTNKPFFLSGDSNAKGPGFKENIQEGMLAGTSNSMDRLSKYYIDRAEQIQPVIDIDAGRILTVFFTKEAYIAPQEEQLQPVKLTSKNNGEQK